MSGGAFDYRDSAIDDIADEIERRAKREPEGDGYVPHFPPGEDRKQRYLGFVQHLREVGRAVHDIDYVLSGDYGDDGADASIERVLTLRVRELCRQILTVRGRSDTENGKSWQDVRQLAERVLDLLDGGTP